MSSTPSGDAPAVFTPPRYYPTCAEAIAFARTLTDIGPSQRAKFISGVNAVLHGRPAEAIRLTPGAYREFKNLPPAALGIRPVTKAGHASALGALMRRMGLLAPRQGKPGHLPLGWQPLRALLPGKGRSVRLETAMGFWASCGLAPAQVHDEQVLHYLEHVTHARVVRNPRDLVRRVIAAWNKAAGTIPGWPQQRLSPLPPIEGRQYSLSFEDCPKPFQADAASYLEGVTRPRGPRKYTGRSRKGTVRPITARGHAERIRYSVTALVKSGFPIEQVTGLHVLVQPENIMRILDWHCDRLGLEEANGHVGNIANMLRIILRHHAKLPDDEAAEVEELLADWVPKPCSQMTEKNERRLMLVVDHRKLGMLIRLPRRLFAEARALVKAGDVKEGGWLAGVALAIMIELRCPMRRANLVGLRMDRHLLREAGRNGRIIRFMIEGVETKTGAPLRWPVSPKVAEAIDIYLKEFWPLVAPPGSPFLFPHRLRADEHRAAAGFAGAICRAIHDRIGVEMNLHLFRAICGSILLEDNPDALDDLRQLLGHTTLQTSLQYYRARNPDRVARRVDAALDRLMRDTEVGAEADWNRLHGRRRAA